MVNKIKNNLVKYYKYNINYNGNSQAILIELLKKIFTNLNPTVLSTPLQVCYRKFMIIITIMIIVIIIAIIVIIVIAIIVIIVIIIIVIEIITIVL